jgi:diadenosine tetraphosphate (Ap4A) HIT family hydrolase
MSDDWKKDRIGSAQRGENPLVLAKMKSGFAVIGDTQFLPGYCVLLAYPQAESLNDLSFRERSDYLLDMSLIGDAIERACNPRRVNYSILGNTDPFLHAHIFPRYEWEPEELKLYPVWRYPNEKWSDRQYHYNEEKHRELRAKITEHLLELMDQAYK